MSNLSDLLPAGASGKTIEATATATIASKAPVILNSAGTVTPISETSVSENLTLGSVAEWSSTEVSNMDVAFDSGADTVVVVYRDNGTSNYLGTRVGTVNTSTGAVTWGTKTILNSANSQYPKVVDDPNATGKFVVTFSSGGTQSKVALISVTGTTPTYAGEVNIGSGTKYFELAADPNTSQLFVAGAPDGSTRYVNCVAFTYSGTTFTIGSQQAMSSTTVEERQGFSIAFDQITAGKFACAYQQYASPYHGYFVAGTISGTTVTAGTEEVFRSGTTYYVNCAFDGTTADKFITTYYTASGNIMGATVATISGTDATWGTEVTDTAPYTPQSNQGSKLMPVYGTGNNYYLSTPLNGTSTNVYLVRITTSGTVPTWATWTAVGDKKHGGDQGSCGMSRYSTGAMFSAWLENTTDDGDGRFSQGAYISTNLTAANFVGLADAGISTSATGTIVVQGGTVTYPAQPALSAGDPVQFESGSNSYNASVFDSNANKIVAFYDDIGNSNYGTAAVGTVSGMTSTWGTPVVFNSAGSSFIAAAFDSDANKTVTVYRDAGNSSYGTAIVGTVSGTSISFGTEADFNAASTTNIGIGFDSTANKVVVAFRDDGNSDHGTAVVGTVSGTGISFGAENAFQTNQTSLHHVVYDPDENKTVLVYKHDGNSSYGTSNVCTITGTSIAFGTDVIFKAASTDPGGAVYDTAADKVVIAYGISGAANAIVGTVSGTSISYGAEAVMVGTSTSVKSAAFDSTANKTMVAFVEAVTTFDGWAIAGTVSGTSISFGTSLNFTDPNNANNIATAYDSNADRTVFTYKDTPEADGRAVVLSATTTLTIGSNYYVQNDGTITAVSSSVKAGLATSTTQLLLNGDS